MGALKMAEPITMQKLTGASFDADTLGEFANDDKIVTSRNGREYPSAPMASRLVVENGLLGATPFSTYESMTVSALVDSDYAIVVNDSDNSKNGVYQKQGEEWSYLAYNVQSSIAVIDYLARQAIDSSDRAGVISDYLWGVIDKNNQVGIGLDSEGRTHIVRHNESAIGNAVNRDIVAGTVDANNNIVFGYKEDGSVWFKPSDELIRSIVNTKSVSPSDINFADRVLMPVSINASAVKFLSDKNGLNAYIQRTDIDSDTAMIEPQKDIIYIPAAGQSLSIGGGATENGLDVEDYTHTKQAPLPHNAFMFNDGTRGAMYRNLDESDLVDFVPAYEQFNNENQGETQGSGLMRQLVSLNDDNPIVYRSHGVGGRTIAELSKGGSTPAYINGLKELNKAVEIASKYAQSITCYAFTWTQGEQDRGGTLFNEYRDALITLIDNYRNDYAEILPSGNPQLHCIIDQMSASTKGEGSDIELAQYAVAEQLDYAHISTPKYFMPYSKNLHLKPKWYSILGEYQARCYDALFISKTDWQPLKPLSINNVDNIVDITFNVPTPPLLLDTSTIEQATSYGFEFYDDGGAVITDVAIVAEDTVRLTLDKNPTTNKVVAYAHNGIELPNGSHSGAWGNLHDSDNTPSLTDSNIKLHNWCLTFKEQI